SDVEIQRDVELGGRLFQADVELDLVAGGGDADVVQVDVAVIVVVPQQPDAAWAQRREQYLLERIDRRPFHEILAKPGDQLFAEVRDELRLVLQAVADQRELAPEDLAGHSLLDLA